MVNLKDSPSVLTVVTAAESPVHCGYSTLFCRVMIHLSATQRKIEACLNGKKTTEPSGLSTWVPSLSCFMLRTGASCASHHARNMQRNARPCVQRNGDVDSNHHIPAVTTQT